VDPLNLSPPPKALDDAPPARDERSRLPARSATLPLGRLPNWPLLRALAARSPTLPVAPPLKRPDVPVALLRRLPP
jgi:hypothetical protein